MLRSRQVRHRRGPVIVDFSLIDWICAVLRLESWTPFCLVSIHDSHHQPELTVIQLTRTDGSDWAQALARMARSPTVTCQHLTWWRVGSHRLSCTRLPGSTARSSAWGKGSLWLEFSSILIGTPQCCGPPGVHRPLCHDLVDRVDKKIWVVWRPGTDTARGPVFRTTETFGVPNRRSIPHGPVWKISPHRNPNSNRNSIDPLQKISPSHARSYLFFIMTRSLYMYIYIYNQLNLVDLDLLNRELWQFLMVRSKSIFDPRERGGISAKWSDFPSSKRDFLWSHPKSRF